MTLKMYQGVELEIEEFQALEDILSKIKEETPPESRKYVRNKFKARDHHVISLKIWNTHIEQLPESIKYLKYLTELSLSNTKQIRSFPEYFKQLNNLKRLEIKGDLKVLPQGLCELKSIESLNLWANHLINLPDSLSNLSALKFLFLNANELKSLPYSIGELKKLSQLFLSFNNLESLPESIGGLENLKELYLRKNKLKTLPESIGKLKNLKRLQLQGNPIESLPQGIEKLKNLEFLNLKKTNLTILPPTIKKLQEYGCIIYNIHEFKIGEE